MIINILGLIAGPLMIGTDIGLLVVLGWIWMVSACIGVVWFLGALIMALLSK